MYSPYRGLPIRARIFPPVISKLSRGQRCSSGFTAEIGKPFWAEAILRSGENFLLSTSPYGGHAGVRPASFSTGGPMGPANPFGLRQLRRAVCSLRRWRRVAGCIS